MKKRKRGLQNVRTLTTAAMLAGLSVVIGILCKSLLTFGALRVTFENFPIILSGILYGPVVGALVGITSDIISAWASGFSVSPIITLGAALIGAIPGIISHYVIKKDGILRIVTSAGAAHVIGSMIVKSIGLYLTGIYADALIIIMLERSLLYLAIGAVEISLLCFLFKKTAYRKLFYGKGELK